jgi:hypothetical protein
VSGTEYLLLALVILVPLVIAVMVTLWTLEQARKRSAKSRKQPANRDFSTPEQQKPPQE